ncbi:MAG: redoxin domain-containing protein [Rickettsiales bacterium]
MLTVGDKFPAFDLKATVSTEIASAFTSINNDTYKGKWLVVFFWPKDFTFVCPTEIAAFGKLNGEFADRDACAEAMTLMKRMGKSKSDAIFVARDCHPQTVAVIETRAEPMGYRVIVGDPKADLDPAAVFGAVFQYPTTDGRVEDYAAQVAALHEAGALATVCADPLSLVLLTPPGEWGADVVVGSAQRFGVPMGFGGPHAGYMATRDAFKRSMPGRLIGVSVDSNGDRALRMALQTREQHIRREKATSNICTAQVLLANIAGMYAVYHGPDGLRTIARRVHRLTAILAAGLTKLGLSVETPVFFDTITVAVNDAAAVHARAVAAGYNLRPVGAGHVGAALDETTTAADVARRAFGAAALAGAHAAAAHATGHQHDAAHLAGRDALRLGLRDRHLRGHAHARLLRGRLRRGERRPNLVRP